MVINLGGKPGQALFIDIDPERINTSDSDVYSEIELQAVNKKGIVDIVTDDKGRVALEFCLNHLKWRCYRDAFALRTVVWLGNVCVLVFLHFLF